MKIVILNKYKKKIKIVKNLKNFKVIGPLGILEYTFINIISYSDNFFFLNNTSKIFFINKLKMLFRSVSTGWFKELKFKGIGYKCFKMEDKIALDLGYSNLITYKPCSSVRIRNLKNKVVLFGIEKEHLNNIAISLKNYSKPDAYKGKGIWFKNEILKLKKKSRI